MAFREREVTLKERDSAQTKRLNPLTLSIIAAALAVGGNAWVAWYNNGAQLDLEERKAEAARILEIVKVADPDKAANNLQFLIDTGLIADPKHLEAMKTYLARRKPGQGPVIGVVAGPSIDQIPALEDQLRQEEADLQQKEKDAGYPFPISRFEIQRLKKMLGDEERQLGMPVRPPAQ